MVRATKDVVEETSNSVNFLTVKNEIGKLMMLTLISWSIKITMFRLPQLKTCKRWVPQTKEAEKTIRARANVNIKTWALLPSTWTELTVMRFEAKRRSNLLKEAAIASQKTKLRSSTISVTSSTSLKICLNSASFWLNLWLKVNKSASFVIIQSTSAAPCGIVSNVTSLSILAVSSDGSINSTRVLSRAFATMLKRNKNVELSCIKAMTSLKMRDLERTQWSDSLPSTTGLARTVTTPTPRTKCPHITAIAANLKSQTMIPWFYLTRVASIATDSRIRTASTADVRSPVTQALAHPVTSVFRCGVIATSRWSTCLVRSQDEVHSHVRTLVIRLWTVESTSANRPVMLDLAVLAASQRRSHASVRRRLRQCSVVRTVTHAKSNVDVL